jgi:hypothetical protein
LLQSWDVTATVFVERPGEPDGEGEGAGGHLVEATGEGATERHWDGGGVILGGAGEASSKEALVVCRSNGGQEKEGEQYRSEAEDFLSWPWLSWQEQVWVW